VSTSDVAAANKAVVEAFFNTADANLEDFMTRLTKTVDPDFVVHQAAGLPWGGDHKGPDGFVHVQELIRGELLDLGVADLEIWADGDVVISKFRLLGTSKTTGKKYDVPQVEIWRFRDGKPVSLTPFYYDTHEVRNLVGQA